MREKIWSTKHYVSVAVSNSAPTADIGASSLLPSSAEGEKGAYLEQYCCQRQFHIGFASSKVR